MNDRDCSPGHLSRIVDDLIAGEPVNRPASDREALLPVAVRIGP
jgi:hypothetical protein